MKLRTAIAVAAISLATVPTIVSTADAGIIIRFGAFRIGGVHRHHTVRHRHHAEPTRVARKSNTRRDSASNKDSDVTIANKNGVLTYTFKDGTIAYAYGGKPKLTPMVVKRPGASQEKTDWVTTAYTDLPRALTSSAGSMVFYVSNTIGEFRKFSGLYDAPDGMDGKAFLDTEPKNVTYGACKVSLITANMPTIGYLAYTMAHELAHCVDLRVNVTGRDDFMRALYKDVKDDETKEQIAAHGLGHYTNPKEAWAEAVAQMVIDVPDALHDQFLKDFPATNAVVADILRKAGIEPFDYIARKAKNAAPVAQATIRTPAAETVDY